MTQVILIRHGETLWNQQRRMQGHSNRPLSETGVRQASQLAQRLGQLEFSTLYSSDSERAHHTARCVAEVTGHDIVLEPRLRERHFGVFEGLTGTEISSQFPEAYARFKARDQDYVIPGGGESARQFRTRVSACLQQIAERHARELVVVITHGLVLDVFYRAALGIPHELPRIHELVNAGINRLRYDSGAWHIEAWADGSHLDASVLTSA